MRRVEGLGIRAVTAVTWTMQLAVAQAGSTLSGRDGSFTFEQAAYKHRFQNPASRTWLIQLYSCAAVQHRAERALPRWLVVM